MRDESIDPGPEEDNPLSFPLPLPPLRSTSLHHPDCCLGLSTTLLNCILDILPTPSPQSRPLPVLSIGSGTGLFEALLATDAPKEAIEVHGVEVASSSSANKYLPLYLRHSVASTSTLYDDASDFGAWIFVYPRDPRLVRKYLNFVVVSGQNVTILFLGPKADFLPPTNPGASEDEEAQESFANVLGSFSDHIERCHDFIRQDESTSLARTVGDDSACSKPFKASVFSSTDAGLPSYEVLCVLR